MKRFIKGFWLLLQWQLLSLKPMLFLFLIVQSLLAVGIIVGFSFLIPDMDPVMTLYLTTGAPTVILLSVGLVILPQGVAEAKTDGTLDYLLSWPLPRLAYLLVDALVWLLVTFPGILIALLVATLRFDLTVSLGVESFLVMIFTGLTAIAIGYAMTLLLQPRVAELLSQVTIFGVLLFSPINFPAERLPDWLVEVHRFLPVQYMADAVRGTLAPDHFDLQASTILILLGWCLLSFIVSYGVITRRR